MAYEIEQGARFHRWIVINEVSTSSGRRRLFCRCDCGIEKVVALHHLKAGASKSCGCLTSDSSRIRAKAQAIHGLYKSPTYRSWAAMKYRCQSLNPASSHRYRGRGITVCDRWQDFKNFLADMGKRPEGTTLDRINNDGHYDPDNCRWATVEVQSKNRQHRRGPNLSHSTVSVIRSKLKHGESIKQIALSLMVPEGTIYRIRKGQRYASLPVEVE